MGNGIDANRAPNFPEERSKIRILSQIMKLIYKFVLFHSPNIEKNIIKPAET